MCHVQDGLPYAAWKSLAPALLLSCFCISAAWPLPAWCIVLLTDPVTCRLFTTNDAKNSPSLYTGAESSLGDRVLGEAEKDSFIAFPGKGGQSGLLPSKTLCPNPGEFDEEFYGKGGVADQIRVCAGYQVVSPNLGELLWSLYSHLRWFPGCSSLD